MKPSIDDLVRGEVHVWHASPALLRSGPANYRELLVPEEMERSTAFVFEKDRDLSLLGRVLLRTALSSYLNVAPHEWRFIASPLGKPRVDRPEEGRALQFNLAHTQGLCACVVAWRRAVGIDVEDVNRQMDWDLVARSFSPEEYQQILGRPPENRRKAFFAFWTLKEAYAKACGRGLGSGVNESRFKLAEDDRLLAAFLGQGDSKWSFFCPTLSPAHRVAVAVEGSGDAAPRLVVREPEFSAES